MNKEIYNAEFWEIEQQRLSCKDCCCSSCSQQENCAMNGCEGGGCTEEFEYFKTDCDDYEPALRN